MADDKRPQQIQPRTEPKGQPKKPEPQKGQDSQRSSRTPESEPPKEKRSDDL